MVRQLDANSQACARHPIVCTVHRLLSEARYWKLLLPFIDESDQRCNKRKGSNLVCMKLRSVDATRPLQGGPRFGPYR